MRMCASKREDGRSIFSETAKYHGGSSTTCSARSPRLTGCQHKEARASRTAATVRQSRYFDCAALYLAQRRKHTQAGATKRACSTLRPTAASTPFFLWGRQEGMRRRGLYLCRLFQEGERVNKLSRQQLDQDVSYTVKGKGQNRLY